MNTAKYDYLTLFYMYESCDYQAQIYQFVYLDSKNSYPIPPFCQIMKGLDGRLQKTKVFSLIDLIDHVTLIFLFVGHYNN